MGECLGEKETGRGHRRDERRQEATRSLLMPAVHLSVHTVALVVAPGMPGIWVIIFTACSDLSAFLQLRFMDSEVAMMTA